jgi:hypothetical protein
MNIAASLYFCFIAILAVPFTVIRTIGLAFVYLLLAIICTTVTACIVGITSVRTKTLAKGIQKNGKKNLPDGDSHATAPRRSAHVLVLLPCLVFFSTGCGGIGNIPVPKNLTAIRHTVFIINENHTFDNYFGTFPGADGATCGLLSTGEWVPLSPMPDSDQGAMLCNGWDCSLQAIDTGKMDKFDMISGGTWSAYTQATQQQIPNYWAYARRFTLADHYFTSVHGPSLPNHLFAIAAQSGGAIDNGENPGPRYRLQWRLVGYGHSDRPVRQPLSASSLLLFQDAAGGS